MAFLFSSCTCILLWLRQALARARDDGHAYLVIAGPDGDIVWVSGLLPGVVHDLTAAARVWGIIRERAASGLVVLADKGYAASSASSAAVPGGPGCWPRRFTSFSPAKSQDENAHCHVTQMFASPRLRLNPY